MKFDWNKWEEMPLSRRNTLQLFITTRCQLSCNGCFAKPVMDTCRFKDMSLGDFEVNLNTFEDRGGKQVNLLGGEPLLHPRLGEFLDRLKTRYNFKVTIYTNGINLDKFPEGFFEGMKIRQSIYTLKGDIKPVTSISRNHEVEANFMVDAGTSLDEMLLSAYHAEGAGCKTFFIYSFRQLENSQKEFFFDTEDCMPVIAYKALVHEFLESYNGWMDVHISKRGVFESTKTLPDTKCRFANVFPDSKVIQCPYDVVNLKYQTGYKFGERNCQHNNTCLMSKIILKRKK